MDPPPVSFCSVDAGLTVISVSSVNRSPSPLTVIDTFPALTEGDAAILNTTRPSLFGATSTDWLLLPDTSSGPVTLIVAVASADLDVVLLIETGTDTESCGLRNLGSAVLITNGSATVCSDAEEPKDSL